MNPLVTALGWALIHSVWQGALVALILAAVLRVLRERSTNARYAAACAALLLMLILPLATFAIISLSTAERVTSAAGPAFSEPQAQQGQQGQQAPEGQGQGQDPTNSAAQSPILPFSPHLLIRSSYLVPLMPWLIVLWLFGEAFFCLRMIGGWLYTRRLRHYGTRSLEERWQAVLRRLCRQLRVMQPVRLLESALVDVPMAIGWLRPVILLPLGALFGLSPQQLEAIIAHELAHIRRHDYLVNLLQAVIETLLFYHPGVWWVSRRIRQEREHCCDDLAVVVCGDALTYARALLEMEQLRAARPQLAMAANGGLLMSRIQRLVGVQTPQTNRFTGLVAGLIVIITVVGVGMGAQVLLPSSGNSSPHDRASYVGRGRQEAKKANTPRALGQAVSPTQSIQNDRAVEALIPALQDKSWEARKAAVETLAQLTGSRVNELLITALKDSHVQVREQAVIGLLVRGDDHLIEHLIVALTDPEWSVREQAAIALGKPDIRGDERAVQPLLAALLDSEWAVREQVARSLGTFGQERAVEPLINALREQHEQVREAAAKSLGLIGDPRAVEPLNQALQDINEQVRKKAAEALGLLKRYSGRSSTVEPGKSLEEQATLSPGRTTSQEAAVAASLSALHSSNPAERAAAACSLGRLGAAEAIPALLNLLSDDTPIEPIKCWESGNWSPALDTLKQPSPGEQAAIALAALSRPAVEPLIAAIGNANPTVRRNAAWAIGEVTGVSVSGRYLAVEPLLNALRDSDSWVRLAAAFSLGELRPRRATDALVIAMNDTESNVREMAARALGEMKTHSGVESLTAVLLRDGDEQVRRKAAWALGEIKDPLALDALSTALTDQDQRVRASARRAIAEIVD